MNAVETYFTIQLAQYYASAAIAGILLIGIIVLAVVDHFKK